MESLNLDDRVRIIGRNLCGKIAYIGETHTSKGEWFGIVLDEPKGRNNGCLDGKRYFKCPRNHGMFARACQLERETGGSREKTQYPNYLGVSSNSRTFFLDEEDPATSRKANGEPEIEHPKASHHVAPVEFRGNEVKVKSTSVCRKFRPGRPWPARIADERVSKDFGKYLVLSETIETSGAMDSDSPDRMVGRGDKVFSPATGEGNEDSSIDSSASCQDQEPSVHDRCTGDAGTGFSTVTFTSGDDQNLPENIENTREGSFLSCDASAEGSMSTIADEEETKIRKTPHESTPKNKLKRLSSELQFSKTQNVKLERELQVMKIKMSKLNSELNTAETKLAKFLRKSEENENRLRRRVINAEKQVLLLTKELRATKRKLELSEDSRRSLEAELEEVKEVTEHAVVEKEIAGERIENLESSLAEETEKRSHLEVEIEILKEEMQIQRIDGIPAFHLLRRFETENEVLRNALRHLKKLHDALHEDLLASKREIDAKSQNITELKETGKDLEKAISDQKMEMADLYDNMDSMLFVDDIVFQVTDRNLTYETQLQALKTELKDAEEQLEVSDSIIETLESLEQISCEEKERLNFELRNAESALEIEKLHVRNKQIVIEKYRELTAALKHENSRLTWEVECAHVQKQEAVIQAETIKMKIHREEMKRMREVVEVEKMRINIDGLKEKLNHLRHFLPDEIIDHKSTIKVIDTKSLASTLLRKVELFTTGLQTTLLELCNNPESETAQTLTSGIHVLEEALRLKSAFLQIERKFNGMHLEELFYLDKNYDDLIHFDSKIDEYFTALTNNEIDRKTHFDSMQAGYLRISQNFNLQKSKHYLLTDLENHLIVSHIQCKVQLVFCDLIIAKEVGEGYTKQLKQLKTSTKALERTMRRLYICLSKEEREVIEPDASGFIRNSCNCLRESFDLVIRLYDAIVAGGQIRAFPLTNDKFDMIKETVLKLENCQAKLECSFGSDCIFSLRDVEKDKPSAIEKWAKTIKQREKDVLSNFKQRILSLESELRKQARELLRERAMVSRYKNEIEDLKRTHGDNPGAKDNDPSATVKTPHSSYTGDCSLTRKYATLKLLDLENSVRYLSRKNWDLKLQQSRTLLRNWLLPLRVMPKKHQAETESVRKLQRRLDDLLTRLTPLLVPRVIDISEKGEGKDRYGEYLAERALGSKGIEEELWMVARDLKRLKCQQRVFGKCVYDSL